MIINATLEEEQQFKEKQKLTDMNDNERIREILFPKKAIHAPRYEMFIELLKEMAQRGEGRWYDMRNPNYIVVGCTEEEASDLLGRFVL